MSSLLFETKSYQHSMTPYSKLKEEIDALIERKGGNRAELLRMATSDPEVEKSKFYKFLKGETIPQGDTLLEWITRMGFTLTPPDEKLESFSLVSMVEAKAGAGESFVTSGRVTGQYAFRDAFLRREGLSATTCVLMQVIGDSMEPLIKEGDTILIDESEKGRILRDGQIFVFGLDDALMVKRAEKIPGGWRLRSENRDRGDVDIIGEEMERLRTYGRVRWFGRVL